MADLFLRTYTFVDGTTAYGSQVESEFSTLVTKLNDLNTANTNWGRLAVSHATQVPLIADNAAGSQHIADFKNNTVIKASVGSDGEITILTAGKGLVCTTPDGLHTYRLAVANDGTPTFEAVS